ncbi:hypothetical protein PIB30_089605 [Stylosanthes scabra]|uniref:Uncharacterized protein n=1 Tax=Stylosanthes scabra TaxID=79078 RepID=A0ABU6UTG8_9FABA|nr:hypothetical protein [Stylosanthes scabra]
MLEVAEKYEKAFARHARENPHFKRFLDDDGGPPNDEDWIRARIFMRILCTLNKWIVTDDLFIAWDGNRDES